MTTPRERILAKLKTEFDDSANPPSNMDIADYSMYQGKAIAFDKAIEIVERELAESDAENARLREALSELVCDIENWEAAVRAVIQTNPAHGMDLAKAKAALEYN